MPRVRTGAGVTLLCRTAPSTPPLLPPGTVGDVRGERKEAGQEDEEPTGQRHPSRRAGALPRRREQSLPAPRYDCETPHPGPGWVTAEGVCVSSSPPPHLRAGCPRLLRPGGRRGAPGVGAPLRSVPCPWLLWPCFSLIHVFLRHPSGRTTSPCPPAALTRLKMNSNLRTRAETSLRFLPGLGGAGRARWPHGHCAAPRRIGCAPPVRLWALVAPVSVEGYWQEAARRVPKMAVLLGHRCSIL